MKYPFFLSSDFVKLLNRVIFSVRSHQFYLFTCSQIQINALTKIHPLSPPFLSPYLCYIYISVCLSFYFLVQCVFYFASFSATLLLVPLLGMQYILTPFRPEEGADGAFAYELISAIIISFQVGDNNRYAWCRGCTEWITEIKMVFN